MGLKESLNLLMTKQVELELKLKKKGSNIKTEFEELKIIRKERK
jgi:hypothetical protein